MKAISLIFGTNNGIAVGTPDSRIEDLYQKAFKPFLMTLYKFPDISLTVHYSGALLEWFQEHHPEFIMLISEMVKRGQMEVLGGTYYETVLPLIPSNDRSAQIELLTTLIRRRFGKRPRGAWITELVWEPGMPSSLKRSGMEYTFLSDSHFLGAGLRGPELNEPVIGEDQGKTLLIFPISGEISLFPFEADPISIIDQIQALADESGRRVVSLIADGESFGFWNNSNRTLYEDGWLLGFLEALRAARMIISSTQPRRYWKKDGEFQKRYFSSTSHEEMMSWSLPAARHREFDRLKNSRLSKSNRAYLQGGYFRQFLSKYRESNLMYAKAMHVNILVNQVKGDKYQKRAAREELWKGEDHSAYWHGKRGGIYSHPVRKAVYSALISAEKMSRQRGVFKTHVSTEDFDMDGLTEHLYHGNELNIYLHRKGGLLFELDYLAVPWNYLDTLTRIPESYHENTDGKYIIDTYPRRAFLDHFLKIDEHIDNFEKMAYSELGDFLNRLYTVEECRKDAMEVTFAAEGNVEQNGSKNLVHIKKRFRMKRSTILIDYIIQNKGETPFEACFAPEINLSFPSMDPSMLQHSVIRMGESSVERLEKSSMDGASGFTCLDLRNGVTIQASWEQPSGLWTVPIEASWVDWSGKHTGYQSTCFLPRWNVALESGASWDASLQLTLTKTRKDRSE